MTLIDLCTTFSDDETCRELLERLRWPDGPTCPRCNDSVVRLEKTPKILYCKRCDYQFTVTSGTIFHDSHLPLIKWLAATHIICESKKGISAAQLRRMLWGEHNGSYKTAWYLCHRIRAAMASAEKAPLTGKVEMDETYIGGKQIGKGVWYGKNSKEVVFGIKQRGGELRFFHAADAKSGTLAQYIREHVSGDVDVIMTDEFSSYPYALSKSGHDVTKHRTVQHKAGIYVDGDITTNGIESSFSLLKRGIVGSWHKVSAKHLPAYLEEMTFRFNRRGRADLFIDTLRHMVTANPLTFEALTE